ncbi:hypothetical protein [Cohnella nanjingensis]|uniref:Uncharacterized protein n=1 Tax=Cohnella nanjingensis TaxID=1387779 RepID=A0A7X0VI71_9BACL|nr:hypothetical protein [Cohnella nanjingensis]MBB6674666.1 hypothetical protein [Cohnella nanjingensis]
MWGVIGVTASAVAIAWFEIRKLSYGSRGERWKNIGCLMAMLVFWSGLYIAHRLHAPLPNPVDWIAAACHALGLP